MLTEEEIKSIAKSGEGYNADFKLKVPGKVRELTEEVCAFANSEGGFLLIGINDKDQIIGTEIDNPKRSAIRDSIRYALALCAAKSLCRLCQALLEKKKCILKLCLQSSWMSRCVCF